MAEEASVKSRARLNRELILDAALRVIDGDGLAGLNMRRLAAELDAAPMSLYRYFENKNEILDGVGEVILGDLESPRGAENWTRASNEPQTHAPLPPLQPTEKGAIREIKEWQAIMDYLSSLPFGRQNELPTIPVDEHAAEVRAIRTG